MITDVKQSIGSLMTLAEKLEEIKTTKNKNVNVFDAVGMQRQEIKHSAFFAWLLNPQSPHKMLAKPLRLLLHKLFEWKTVNTPEKFPNNDNILLNTSKITKGDIENLFKDGDEIKVETERSITKEEIDDGRIDVFIENKTTKTLIVIENKVFTTTHDNQLIRYKQEFEDKTDWKQIFIYLSPEGELPRDNEGNLCEDWTVLSYKSILEVCKTIINACGNRKETQKLKILLEDYTEMVETNILKEKKELIRICKEIRANYKNELEILWQYTGEKQIEYCKKWLKENIDGIIELREGNAWINFDTIKIKELFENNGEDIKIDENRYKFRYGFGSKDGPVVAKISMEKEKNADWSKAQLKIKDILAPNKSAGTKYFTVFSIELLSEDEIYSDFSKIKNALDARLNLYLSKVIELENLL